MIAFIQPPYIHRQSTSTKVVMKAWDKRIQESTGGQTKNVWHRWIDTALDSPHDIEEWETARLIPCRTYSSRPHSLVMLFAKMMPQS
ncbi:MAG: hypothetical protein AUH28_08775 [Acidobacteria bacterium 13_1_40CM_56_16]|nr:MAG: hypothetical protein AUH28_08775 [Acidobacteria bacterium 13_1_40CM_56_16]